jgi:hypothetical protein
MPRFAFPIKPAPWLAVALVAALPALVLAAPPRVVEATPRDGDRQVDPATRELRVVFDQPMDRDVGYSVVGGGETYPTVVGKPRWADERTFVLRIRLKPDHDYQLGINGGRFRNFRGAAGEPSEPYPIHFHTAPGAAISRTEANREAVVVLREAIDQDYSYRDLRGVDWDAAFKAATPRLLAAPTAEAFATEAADLIAPARDLHFAFSVGAKRFAPPLPAVAWNLNRASLEREVPGFTRKNRAVVVGRFEDGITYLLIATWELDGPQMLEPAFEAIAASVGTKGLIVDVRPNGGGNENLARMFAGCFVPEPKVYARHIIRSGGRFLPPRDRVVGPSAGRPWYRGKLAVLMGPGNVSSCESFLLMMKQVPGCVLIGAASRGSSGNPQPIDLGNDVTALVPIWKDLRPDGTCFEGEGIAPDVPVPADAKAFATSDPVLQAALKRLRGS